MKQIIISTKHQNAKLILMSKMMMKKKIINKIKNRKD